MLKPKFLREHRAWEDWFVMAVGIAVALAPWVTKETTHQAAVINAAVAGIALMMLAELDLVHFRSWAVLGQLVCGAWIASSSLIFGYAGSGALRIWHLLAGLAAILLGGLEIWQHRAGGQVSERAKLECRNQVDIKQQR